MGFKCRLFGHSYGSPEAERSREEDGDEVVVTVRKVKRCERCGDERTVNQTKEVTSVRTPEEVGLDAAAGESPVAPVEPDATTAAGTSDPVDATVGADADPDPTPDTVDAAEADVADVADGATAPADDGETTPEPADADPDGNATVEKPDVATADADAGAEPAEQDADDGWATGSDDWDDVDPDPDVDDAVILDDAGERDEVQWPEESDAAPDAGDAADPIAPADAPAADVAAADEAPKTDAEIIDSEAPKTDAEAASEWPDHEDAGTTGGWPDHDGADEGYSATPNPDVDAEFVGNGLTPEVNGGAPDGPDAADGITVGGGAAERTFADADTDEGFVSVGDATAEDVPADRVEFYCPNCGHARVAGASSIRAGDICPECKKGYIAERER